MHGAARPARAPIEFTARERKKKKLPHSPTHQLRIYIRSKLNFGFCRRCVRVCVCVVFSPSVNHHCTHRMDQTVRKLMTLGTRILHYNCFCIAFSTWDMENTHTAVMRVGESVLVHHWQRQHVCTYRRSRFEICSSWEYRLFLIAFRLSFFVFFNFL